MSNALSEEKRQHVLALGRLGWPLRRIEKQTGVRHEAASARLKTARPVRYLFHVVPSPWEDKLTGLKHFHRADDTALDLIKSWLQEFTAETPRLRKMLESLHIL